MLDRANMTDAKTVSTPMSTSFSSTTQPDSTTCDASLYRSLVGSLHYLALTRPDVAFPVNKLSQNMQNPTDLHMQALKRVLRYLKFTIDHGLHLTESLSTALTAFCDADWGGDNSNLLVHISSTLAQMPFHGHAKSNPLSHDHQLKQSTELLRLQQLNCCGFNNF